MGLLHMPFYNLARLAMGTTLGQPSNQHVLFNNLLPSMQLQCLPERVSGLHMHEIWQIFQANDDGLVIRKLCCQYLALSRADEQIVASMAG